MNFKYTFLITTFFIIVLLSVKVKSENLSEITSDDHVAFDTATVHKTLEKAYNFYYKDNDKLYQYANKALEISRKIGYQKGEANSLRLIGMFYDFRGNYDSSLVNYEESIRLCEEIDYNEGLAKTFNNIGVTYFRKGYYHGALEAYYKALKIQEKQNQQHEIAKLYNNIGLIYRNQNDYDLAISNYNKALKIFKTHKDTFLISKIYNNLGVSYRSQEKYDEALNYYMKALELNLLQDKISEIEKSYINIGNVYSYSDRLPEAEENYQKAFEYGKESDNPLNKCSLLTCYSMLCDKQNDREGAYEASKKAYLLAKKLNNAHLLKTTSNNLSESSYKLGLYKEAYETHVEFKTIHDSLLNESNYKELIQKEYQYKKTKDKEIYEFEQALNELKIKKQQVILYLQLGIIIFIVVFAIMLFRNYQLKSKVNKTLETKNVEIKHINEQLKKSNDTKDTLFSIIAHDLRSPFNNILGFSDLLKEELKGEEISKKYNDIIISSAQNTLILLDNLLNWAKCQKGQIRIDKETLNINALVSNAIIENNAKAELKGIKINSIVPDNLMLKLDKHTMSICINNLISNALKYTDKGGCVCVSTDHTSLGTSIIIQDNGAGMTEEQMGKLFKPDASYTTVGTDKEKGSGLGLILCKEFVERNGGTLNLESKVDNGTKVILSFQNE